MNKDENTNHGHGNTGILNSGDYNSGHYNSGHYNSGRCNSGRCNSGDWNSGDYNSGDYNSGDYNSGIFNTNEPFMRAFNKPTTIKRSQFHDWPDFTGVKMNEWIEEEEMTENEKVEHPSYKKTGGYLRTIPYKKAWARWKEECTEENWKKVLALPNFDPHIFEEITGIKVKKDGVLHCCCCCCQEKTL